MSTVVESSVKYGQSEFVQTARLYAGNTKVRRIVDSLLASKDDRESNLEQALEVIERLRTQSEVGSAYTPDKSLGFGSDNAATIAEKMLGIQNSPGETRKAFAKIGSNL